MSWKSQIEALAGDSKTPLWKLLAMSDKNDPFNCGTKGDIQKAEWFARIWEDFGYKDRVHLRRIHYQIISQSPPVIKPDGAPYENIESCWNYLGHAASMARYQRLVDPRRFVDMRNPDPIIHRYCPGNGSQDPEFKVWDRYQAGTEDGNSVPAMPWPLKPITLPELEGIPSDPPDLPEFEISGYDDIEQPYLVEVWAEKSTMNDVLVPLCNRYGVNLIPGAGEQSITAVLRFLDRVKLAGMPGRILYISDFDPAGVGMPISIARKIEFFQYDDPTLRELDITLDPIVLTRDQVDQYDLPRIWVKDSDLRKHGFEKMNGKGQVELDALEARHPGVLGGIVSAAIRQYYDRDLMRRALEVGERLEEELDKTRDSVMELHKDEIEESDREYQKIHDKYEALKDSITQALGPFQERIDELDQSMADFTDRRQELAKQIADSLSEAGEDVDMEEFALPEPELPAERQDLLYRSERNYLDQLHYYHQRRPPTPPKGRKPKRRKVS